ncbi:MAG: 50S ribosomal protein L28 [Chloroflexi bacterium]|nr:50S ribosomal protein L28 [Chloroflexota bacterium]
MAKCYLCNRGPQFGNNVSHSNVKTKRQWRMNIQKRVIMEDGRPKRVSICAKCLKTLTKSQG